MSKKVGMLMMISALTKDIAVLLSGFICLIASADRFVIGASRFARLCGISPMVVGIVLVGFATALPELLVSLFSALKGSSGLAVGNALGSYLTNLGLVLGVSALVCPLLVSKRLLTYEYPIMFASLLLAWLLMSDGFLSQGNAYILLMGFFAYGVFLWFSSGHESKAVQKAVVKSELLHHEDMSMTNALLHLILGLAVMLFSVNWITVSAIDIARYFKISEMVIGLTIVAIGTSLPELAASVISALKGEHEIAVGNVIGSNIIGMLAVLAMPALFSPGKLDPMVLKRDLPLMLAMTIFSFLFLKRDAGRVVIGRFLGAALLLSYLGYLVLIVLTR
jgi:cation:H+ antiporter